MSYNKVITCASYGGTGSSVVTDLLKEFDNAKSFGSYEFTIAHEPNGISDLQHYIVDDFHRIKVDEGIYRFEKNIQKISKVYDANFNNKFTLITNDYLNELVSVCWKGNSFTHQDRYSKIEYFIRFSVSDKIQRILHKILRRSTGYEFVPRFPKMDMKLPSCTKEQFLNITRKYTESIFDVANDNGYEYIVFDQLVPPTNTSRYINYFNDLKIIVVDRDPRDLYLLNKMFWKEGWIPTDNVEDFIQYFNIIRDPLKYEKDDEDKVLRVKFEDLVLKYDESIDCITKFIGISKESHIYKKKFFNPEVSIKNLKLWKKYKDYDEDIKIIEQKLSEYIYNY